MTPAHGQSRFITADKRIIMLIASTEASFRHLRVWEALPNPDWEKNKAGLGEAARP